MKLPRRISAIYSRKILSVATGFLLISLAACSRNKGASADFLTLKIPMGNDPYVLDPQSADTGASVFVLRQMVSTLFKYDSKGALINDDADRYAWSADGTSLTIFLRKGLKWSDGVALTSCQYRDGILRALDPSFVAPLSDLLFDIAGAAERKAHKTTADKVGVACDEQANSLTLTSSLPHAARLLHALTYVVAAPFRADREKTLHEAWLVGNKNTPAIASNAFVLAGYQRDRTYVLRARRLKETDLAEDRIAKVDAIEMPIVREPLTALALFESGTFDVLPELPVSLLPKLAKRSDFRTYPNATTYMIGLSLKANPVLKDKRVRQALALAAHQAEVPKLLSGGERAAFAWVPPVLANGTSDFDDPFNPTKAKAILKEAGFANGKGFPTLKLYYNGGERHQLLMERIAHNWKEHLNINVLLEPIEWKVLVAQLKRQAPDLYRYAWSAAYLDPLFFLELFVSTSPNNFGGWKNTEYDKLIAQLVQVPLEKRDASFWAGVKRAQQILVIEDPALIPIYHYTRNILIKDSVKGLELNPQGTLDLSKLSR